MSKTMRAKAIYIVNTMVGEDKSEGHNALARTLIRAVHHVKAWWWIQKVNHMSEGEILELYYLLTDKEAETC